MLAARSFRVLVIASLLGCVPARTPTPVAPEGEPAEPVARGETGATVSVAQPHDAGAAAYDQVIADLVGECGPVLETSGSTEPPQVSDRRVDLDGDGEDEAIVNVSCEDLSMWRVLTRRGDEALALFEAYETSTTFDVTHGPDGRALLIAEHDCCCMYALRVYAMREQALETLYTFESGCAPGCDSGMGYQALVTADAQTLTSIEVPVGECGTEGSAWVDLASWALEP